VSTRRLTTEKADISTLFDESLIDESLFDQSSIEKACASAAVQPLVRLSTHGSRRVDTPRRLFHFSDHWACLQGGQQSGWTCAGRFATGPAPSRATAAAFRAHSSVGRAADS
jgi:hypothetical protein